MQFWQPQLPFFTVNVTVYFYSTYVATVFFTVKCWQPQLPFFTVNVTVYFLQYIMLNESRAVSLCLLIMTCLRSAGSAHAVPLTASSCGHVIVSVIGRGGCCARRRRSSGTAPPRRLRRPRAARGHGSTATSAV